MTLVVERLPATIALALSAVVVSAVIGIPLGIVAAAKRGSLLDDTVIALSTLGLAAPSFWIGTMLIVVFAVQFRLFPPSGGGSLDKLVLPTITLAAGFVAILARFTRSGMIDVLGREYITTARAKGLHARVVLLRHALRNTLIPIVTLLGVEMGALLGGAVVTENVFAWPGIGQLVVQSVFNRDYPLVIATVLTASFMFMIVSLVVDVLYVYINPTVRL
jgi:ABC-type dipeptide/oligopeptide/nickel transport system permease component